MISAVAHSVSSPSINEAVIVASFLSTETTLPVTVISPFEIKTGLC
jgi:hypothetical protein